MEAGAFLLAHGAATSKYGPCYGLDSGHGRLRLCRQNEPPSQGDALAVLVVQVDGTARHDGRNGVLVDQLRMAIAPQQDAEIVKPADDALQLHTIDEKNGQWRFVLPDVIQECILQVLSKNTSMRC